MAGYCLAGACRNFAENRTGDCHDLPLLCEGIEKSVEYSQYGWKELWKLMETSREEDLEVGSNEIVDQTELSRPSSARLRPEKGRVEVPPDHWKSETMSRQIWDI